MLRLPREQSAQRPPPISKPWRACRVQRMLRPWKAVTPISWAKQEAQKKSPECSRRNVSARPSSAPLTPPAGPEILPPTDVERHVSRRRRAAATRSSRGKPRSYEDRRQIGWLRAEFGDETPLTALTASRISA